MKNIKEWDWKKIGWRALQSLLCVLLNTSSIMLFTQMWLERPQTIDGIQMIRVNCLNNDWYDKPLMILFAIVGLILTYGFVKLLYRNHREDKNLKKQSDMQDKQIEKLADKIMKGSN